MFFNYLLFFLSYEDPSKQHMVHFESNKYQLVGNEQSQSPFLVKVNFLKDRLRVK